MKRLFSYLPFLVILLLFFSCFVSVKTYAQTSPPPPSISITPAPSGGEVPLAPNVASSTDDTVAQFTLCPPQFDPNNNPTGSTSNTSDCPPDPSGTYITDFTPKITVSFPGLAALGIPYDKDNYRICFRLDHCSDNIELLGMPTDKLLSYLHVHGLKDDELDHANKPEDIGFNNNYQLTVCGRGDGDLYADKECDPKNGHYFHAGHSYLVTVYYRQSSDDNWLGVAFAGFYVNHGVPDIQLNPNKNFKPGVKFSLSITQSVLRNGGDDNNDYQVVLDRPGATGSDNEQYCGTVKEAGKPLIFDFPNGKDQANGYAVPGQYLFKINERINEGGVHSDRCQGGHTYAYITCNLSPDATKSTCTKQIDPNGDDGNDLSKIISLLSGNSKGAQLPCNSAKAYVSNPLDCPSLDTAIGNIPLDPIGFISKLLAIVLSIAGIAAIIILIYSGYRLLLSRGDKEKVQQARDKITSTVVGLIFIVFSLVLLSVIAHDILKIPGFG